MATRTAADLLREFGGNPDDVTAGIGNPNGWGWADVVLASRLPQKYDGNPYEYGAYDLIRNDWPRVCGEVENGVDGAGEELRSLLTRYTSAFDD